MAKKRTSRRPRRTSRRLTPNDLYKDWDNVNFAQRQAEKSGDQMAIAAAKDEVRRVYDLMQEERAKRARKNGPRRKSKEVPGRFGTISGGPQRDRDGRLTWFLAVYKPGAPQFYGERTTYPSEAATIRAAKDAAQQLLDEDVFDVIHVGVYDEWNKRRSYEEVVRRGETPRKNARRSRRNPGMDAAQFCEAVKAMVDLNGKHMSCRSGGIGGHAQVFVNFINLPAERVQEKRGGGAEAENNRFMAVVAGFSRQLGEPPPTGKVKAETSIALSRFPEPRITMRGKSGTPEAIAKYVADHISKMAQLPGKFTHANPRRNSRKRTSRPKRRTSGRAR